MILPTQSSVLPGSDILRTHLNCQLGCGPLASFAAFLGCPRRRARGSSLRLTASLSLREHQRHGQRARLPRPHPRGQPAARPQAPLPSAEPSSWPTPPLLPPRDLCSILPGDRSLCTHSSRAVFSEMQMWIGPFLLTAPGWARLPQTGGLQCYRR